MARTPLMQKLLQLTKLASEARQKDIAVTDYAEQKMYNRRNFLQASAKAVLATAALGIYSKNTRAQYDDYTCYKSDKHFSADPKIAIIGAGIAGLNAAFILKQSGVHSTLFDAGTRSGGRMFTAQNILNPGLSTELGGEFIDTDHEDMLALAKLFDLPLLDLSSATELALEQDIYYFNGVVYTDKDFLRDISYFLPAIANDANSLSDNITYRSYSAVDKKFDSMSLEQYFDTIGLTGWLRELLLTAYVGEFGLNTGACNCINFLYLFDPEFNGKPAINGSSDQRFKVSGGNQRIVDELAKKLEGQVKLDHKLVRLQATATDYKLYFEKRDVIKADIVVLALPFTLLREVEMHVELPQVKRNAINNLGYGNNSKLVVGFTGRPWRDQYKSNGMCYSGNGLQNGWDNSELQPGSDGGYTVFLGGDDALTMGGDSVAVQAMKYLQKIDEVFPGISSAYNKKAYRMIWPAFPFAKGSYSAWKVGQYTTIAGSEIEPVGNLFFAGEHTSYNFQGYMNGGASTGRIAAQSILKILTKTNTRAPQLATVKESGRNYTGFN